MKWHIFTAFISIVIPIDKGISVLQTEFMVQVLAWARFAKPKALVVISKINYCQNIYGKNE